MAHDRRDKGSISKPRVCLLWSFRKITKSDYSGASVHERSWRPFLNRNVRKPKSSRDVYWAKVNQQPTPALILSACRCCQLACSKSEKPFVIWDFFVLKLCSWTELLVNRGVREPRSHCISLVMSVGPYVCREQLGSHWTGFHEIGYFRIFRKSVEKIHI
jgi:hypothetical protein